MNASETLVEQLCLRSFLSPWSMAQPRGEDGDKELCDLLVVCDPDVIVISVKDVSYSATADVLTGMHRWTKRAVKNSIKQIRGAERALLRLDRVRTNKREPWLALPPPSRRRVHRLAVALGSKGEVLIADGGAKDSFVHVLDERGLEAIMTELDTITDFVAYLEATESFLEKGQVVVEGSENLLGLYIQNGRKFPANADLLIVQDGIWDGLTRDVSFRRRKEADIQSYIWDGLIERLAHEHDPALTTSAGDTNASENGGVERVMRVMAREPRFNRRILAKSFAEFHKGGGIRSRIARSPSGVVYVFLVRPASWNRTARKEELLARMFIARGKTLGATTVVGLATEEYAVGTGSSLDAGLLQKEVWTEDDQRKLEELQSATGAFVNPKWSQSREDEFPSA